MMKRPFATVILLIGVFICLSWTTHPIKLTSTMIKYEESSKTISIESKVFMDDFSPAISATLYEDLQKETLSASDKKGIESYYTAKFDILINGKKLPFKIREYEIELQANVLTLHYSIPNIEFKKGDAIKIQNKLLFEFFGDLQSNWVTIKVPPFIRNSNFEFKIDDPVYTKTL